MCLDHEWIQDYLMLSIVYYCLMNVSRSWMNPRLSHIVYYFQYRPNYTGFYGGNNLHYMPGKTGNNTSEIPLKVL